MLNPHGRFGRTSKKGILNRSSVFGHPDSNYSPCNWRGTAPPVVISSGGIPLGRLTINTNLPDAVQIESIKTWIADACTDRSAIERPVNENVRLGAPEGDARVAASNLGTEEHGAELRLAGFASAQISTVIGKQQFGPELAGFMLTVQRMSDGVSATCEAGCRWQSMTPAVVTCATRKPCLTVTHAGAGARVSTENASFAVTVDVSSTGMTFTCQRGCAWKTLTHDCQSVTPCSVRVSEYGVSRVKPAKTP